MEQQKIEEYKDGPWATGESDSCADNCVGWAYDDREGWGYHKEAAGIWHFPGPDTGLDEVKPPIQIEALEQGFLVRWHGMELAFTDRVDAAEWLLGWLGFDEEILDHVLDILDGLWDTDELYRTDGGPCTWEQPEGIDTCTEAIEKLVEIDYQNQLDVLGAASAFVEDAEARRDSIDEYNKLVEAVKKWRGIDDEPYTKDDFRNDVGSLYKDFLYGRR